MRLKQKCGAPTYAVAILSSLIFVLAHLSIESGAQESFAQTADPIASEQLVFAEKDGLVAVEAEHFFEQSLSEKRAFYLTTSENTPDVRPDSDPSHAASASGAACLEILPDTRVTHDDPLTVGTNFSPEAGKMTIVHYKVHFSKPGRYYVWVRAFSLGTEDNGLHVGIDGRWPESGQRLQWAIGKGSWRWDSMQRTEEVHTGVPHQIFLDVDKAGEHEIQFSMREDGFEFDKWLMTTDRDFVRPEDEGPASVVHAGTPPKPFDPNATPSAVTFLRIPAVQFAEGDIEGYYIDQDQWLAVDPEQNETGTAKKTISYPTGGYHVTLEAVGENDGQSTYTVTVDGKEIGNFTCPLSTEMFEEGETFQTTWRDVQITDGAVIGVTSTAGHLDDGVSRARWAGLRFEAADEPTATAIKPLLEKTKATQQEIANRDLENSPTKNSSDEPLQQPRDKHGDGSVEISGELMKWHKVCLTLDGPFAHEKDNKPNPFLDYRMTATFTHEDGTAYIVPGYFAADGNAAESSAVSGTKWRALFAPDRIGKWAYTLSFEQGNLAAINDDADKISLVPFDGQSGTFEIADSNKTGRDLRGQGRLNYVGKRYLQFSDSKKYFLKVGADAPETLLAFTDFDNTVGMKTNFAPLKTWQPHVKDWQAGDPSWKDGKGKGLIGAINYLSAKGCNAFSFLTYNAGGDGDNVWPFVQRDDKLHYDASKLDQWATVLDHGTAKGMYLHFKLQETEIDDHQSNHEIKKNSFVPECFDGGNLGTQRKLYLREIIARFGHNLALNWNLGEENTQSTKQQTDMLDYIDQLDAYDHHRVVHTYPHQQQKVYGPLLGDQSKLTGPSLQNDSIKTTHEQTVEWIEKSESTGKPWVCAFDESGSAQHAQAPDLGYRGFDGHDKAGKIAHTQHEVRQQTLWGNLMAGGAGCEYYFGYQFAENDVVCQDWRSRDQSWDYCRIAIGFFHDNQIPFWEMRNADSLVGNEKHDNSKYCFAKTDDTYIVYLPEGGTTEIDLNDATGEFEVRWFNPRSGGEMKTGSVDKVIGGESVSVGTAPADNDKDWVIWLRKTVGSTDGADEQRGQ